MILEKIKELLIRPRRAVAAIILGIIALIIAIVYTKMTSTAFTQEIQTVSYVNDLAINVSATLHTQEDIDQKLEGRLNALYETVIALGDQIQGLQICSHLHRHVKYVHIYNMNL